MPLPFDLDVDPDIRRARTPSSDLYTDPGLHDEIIEKAFARSWQFIGHEDDVRVPGSVFPFRLLEGSLDEPLLLTRDDRDRLHLLSNVCTHRGFLVAEHAGCVKHLKCRYHGRRFRLDGTFVSMPECGDAEGFPSDADHLPSARLEQWGPLLFASLDPIAPFQDVFGTLADRLHWWPLEQLKFHAASSRDYLVRANWALYCDNYLEGFHIPFVHAALDQVLDYGSYDTELFTWCNLQLGLGSGGSTTFDLPRSSPDHGRPMAAYYFWVFPNLMFNFYPWGLSVNVVKPLAVDRTKVSFLTYLWKPELYEEMDAAAGTDRVEREDEAVVEGVQLGMRSRLYDRGRYSPKREPGPHHFHRLLNDVLQREI